MFHLRLCRRRFVIHYIHVRAVFFTFALLSSTPLILRMPCFSKTIIRFFTFLPDLLDSLRHILQRRRRFMMKGERKKLLFDRKIFYILLFANFSARVFASLRASLFFIMTLLF